MSQQLQITGGAKVRDLNDVIIGTSGVLSSLAFNVANGVPKLDSNGKILVSQLPNSVMEYKGTWDASTNTPTLVNGTGNQGDVYLCSVAGTVNFGAGAIAFVVSDQVIYSGSIWQKASGSNGTVTSVAITETGDSLNITGSPITTSGTINIGFNGTNLQYINGAGDLTTFPTLSGYVTSVTGTAPVVSSGGTTPAISMAAATASVDGYLSAANFVTFNNKQNAITLTTTGTSGASTLIGATLNIPNYGSALTGYVPYTGATQDVDLGAFKLNAQSLHAKGTGGLGHLGLKHQSASATASANEVSLFADSLGDLGWLNGNLYLSKFITSSNTAARSYTFPNANGTVALTSDISYPVTSVFGRTGAVVATEGDYSLTLLSDVTITTPASGQVLRYNGTGWINSTETYVGTVTSVAALTLGTSGTDLSSTVATSTTTPVITLNVPTASATNRGALSSADWSTFNGKESVLTFSSPLVRTTNTISIPAATTSVNGYLTSTDWTTFNSKQGTITLTTTGSSGAATFSANTLNIPNYGSALSAYLPLSGGTLTGQVNSNSNFNGANFFISSPTAQPATSASVGMSANTTSGYLDLTGYIYGLRIVKSQVGSYGATIATFENNGNITTTGGNTLEGITNIKPNANFTITQNSVVPFTSVSSGAIANSLYLTGRKAGFGTATPRTSASGTSNTLDVKGGIYFGSTNAESCTINNDDSMIFNIDSDNSGTTNFFRFATNTTLETGGTELMRINENGVVTINTLGTGTVTATSGVLSAVSDMNLKISDGYIDTALDKILKLTPRYFYWKEETGLPTDLRQLGFYAQEVNEAIGEEGANTPKNENDKWGIYDRAIIAMLTKGMQEQQAQIEELKALIAAK